MKNINDIQINSYSNFKIILADTDFNTFNEMAKLNDDFCFINLSSDFAVNFVIEYEKIDYLLISNRINNLDKLIIKANKKKIKIFILGKDIEYPLNSNVIRDFLIKEFENNNIVKRSPSFINILKSFFISNSKNWHPGIISNKTKIEKSKIPAKKEPFKKSTLTSNIISVKESKSSKKEEINSINLFLDAINNTESNNSMNIIPESEIIDRETKSNPNNISNPEIKLEKRVNNNFEQFASSNKTNKIEYQIRTIKQKVIAVIKAKGGVGSTTISIFLATLFKDLKTLIIDLNFNEGGSDIGYYLDIPKTPNLMVFTEGFDRNAFLGSILNISGNLDVIQSPPTFMQSKIIDLKDIYNLTDIARKKYDLIIFDLPNNINEFYLGVIDLADLLVMVSDCTNGSIGRLLNLNSKYIYSELEKILVINKFNNANPLKISVESLKDYFNIENIATLKEMDILISKSDFKAFDFNNYEGFKDLTYIVKEVLTK
ncbi:MAG TPA: AAA family ATPase [Candidatus Humimicrobiaceae bacterium]